MRHLRWNLSSRAQELSDADAVVLSIPKSGRTWLRVFLSAYMSAKTGQSFALHITDRRATGVPRIVYSHDRFEQRTKANAWEQLRGKYLVPRAQLLRAPVILLARDPRDAFVSYHVQLTRRNHPAPEKVKSLPAGVLLRHPRFGIGSMVKVMNSWVRELGGRPNFRIVRYEDLRADASGCLRAVLNAIGERQIDEPAFAEALQFSSFDNMQQLEASGAFGDKILEPRDRQDPDSFKVRRGASGTFAQYLSVADREFAAEICAKLDSAFGYKIAPAGRERAVV